MTVRIIELDGVRHEFPAGTTDAEIELALADNAASVHTDKRRLTDAQRLETLKAQLADPARNPESEPELRASIAQLERSLAAAPAAPAALARPSQADVRRVDPALSAKERQRVSEAQFAKATNDWMKATGGVLKDGQNIRQAVAEWAGIQDPKETMLANQAEHAAATGEVEYGDSVEYAAGKGLAAVGGFAYGGPLGATGAEALVRLTALAYNLDKAVKAGMTEDRAAEILAAEMMKGVGEDALFNIGMPVAAFQLSLLGHVASKIPGAKWITEKAKALLPRVAPAAPKPDLRASRLEERAALTDNPARKQAVAELGKRTKEVVPTKGQVTGEADFMESAARRATPTPFRQQERELTGAAEAMRQDLLNPGGQPSAKALGEKITSTAEATQKAVKDRLRPAFQAADNLGVNIDSRGVVKAAQEALAADKLVPGGRLKAAERADLEKIIAELNPETGAFIKMSAEGTLDFVSRQKEKLRAITADGKPSSYYETVLKSLMDSANEGYRVAAGRAGKPDVVKNLLSAQKDYREMMETIYDDAVKQALKKNPEDIGRLFWQGGNVSEIEQLQRMLRIAEREGAASPAYTHKLSRDMARGFLQEAVRDVESAAAWSAALKADPLKRRTWETLTAAPGGKELRTAMEVLEQAAQIASHNSISLAGGQIIPLGRAAGGGMGVSYVTGAIRPGMVLAGISLTGATKALATAYTQGNKGVINGITKVLRANSAGTAASAKALQALLPELEKWAAKNGHEDMFVGQDQAEPEAPAAEPSPFQGGA